MITITGTINQPIYNPRKPYFAYDAAGRSRLGERRFNGSPGHTVSVATDNPEVAKQLRLVFGRVFDSVEP